MLCGNHDLGYDVWDICTCIENRFLFSWVLIVLATIVRQTSRNYCRRTVYDAMNQTVDGINDYHSSGELKAPFQQCSIPVIGTMFRVEFPDNGHN